MLLLFARIQGQSLVGSLPGNLSVASNGSANYAVPLSIPPGRSGLQPSLVLNYNSQAGNGPLGIGWTLSTGFPEAITRGRKIFARDGVVAGIKYDASDSFYLDGKRLILVSGTMGQPGSKYRTEVDSFIEVAASGTSGIDTFTVYEKSGRILIFGKTGGMEDGFHRGGGDSGGLAYSYALKRVEDILGNFLLFTYIDEGEGEYNLGRIDYTGGVGITPNAFVELSYVPSSDQSFRYSTGRRFRSTKQLAAISTHVGIAGSFEKIGNYQLEYDYSFATKRSLLKRIIPSWSSDQAPYNLSAGSAIDLDWGAASGTIDLPGNGLQPGGSTNPGLVGDFDGDGKTDVLFRTGQGYFSYNLVSKNENGWTQKSYNAAPSLINLRAMAVGDFNGDGKKDLLYVKNDSASNQGGWYVALSTGSGFLMPQLMVANNQNWMQSNKCAPGSGLVVDLNGDGIDELLIQVFNSTTYIDIGWPDGDGNGIDYTEMTGGDTPGLVISMAASIGATGSVGSYSLVTPSGPQILVRPSFQDDVLQFSEVQLPSIPYTGLSGPIILQSCDLDGDGRTDLIASTGGPGSTSGPMQGFDMSWKSIALKNIGSDTFQIQETLVECGGIIGVDPLLNTNTPNSAHTHFIADVNGDGLNDFIYLKEESGYPQLSGWFVAISKGDGTFDHSVYAGIPREVTVDGNTVPTFQQRSGAFRIDTISGGDGGSDTYVVGEFSGFDVAGVLLLDFNGDGRKDFVWYSTTAGWRCFLAGATGFDTSTAIAVFGAQNDTTSYIVNGEFTSDVLAVDVGGWGRDSLICMVRSLPGPDSAGVYIAINQGDDAYRVVDVVDGFGSRSKISYAPIASENIYTSGVSTIYPIRENRNMVVVSDVYRDNGGDFSAGERQHFSYQYSGARTDLSGRGFLGFHSFVTLDHQTNLLKYQFLTQSFPMTGLTHREETYRWLGGTSFNIISSHDNTVVFDKVSSGGGATLWPFISKAIEYRWEDGAKSFTVGGSGASSRPEELFGQTDRSGAHITITAQSLFDDQTGVQLTLPGVTGYNPSDFNGTANSVSGTTSFATFSGLPGKITHGNLRSLETDFGGGYGEKVLTTYYPAANGLSGLVHTQQTETWGGGYGTAGSPWKSPKKTFSYWSNNTVPLVYTEEVDPTFAVPAGSVNLKSKLTYARDARGRVTSTEIYSPDSAIGTYTVSSATAFDDRFDLPTTTKNAAPYEHATTVAYHPFFALSTSVTSVNNTVVTTTYDALGRADKVTDEDKGLTTTTTYAWDASQTVSHASGLTLTSVYKVTTTSTVQPTVTTYYDRLSRPIRTIKNGFGTLQVYTDTVYNALGQVVASSLPYPSDGTALWTTTTYDAMGRVKTVTVPNATVTTNDYYGRATKVTIDARQSSGTPTDVAKLQVNTTLVDPKGRTVKVWNADNVPALTSAVSDIASPSPSIAFTIDGFGRMRETTLKGQTQTITADYDALGRQTALNDPDKGNWTYVNNALGQVVSQTDARLVVTQSTFDRLGRPLVRTTTEPSSGPVETAKWFYYEANGHSALATASLQLVAKGTKGWIGSLQRSESATTGAPGYAATNSPTTTLHYYSPKGMPELTVNQIDGTWFYSHTGYDTYFRPSTTRYYWRPANAQSAGTQPYVWQDFGYTYTYDAESYLLNVTDSLGRPWWDNPVYDHLDRVTSVRKGSGHTTVRGYRPTDGVLESITTGGGAIQNLGFTFDGLGNLKQRTNANTTTGTETLTYDNLNRLTHSTKQGSTAYFDNGNIKNKTGVAGETTADYTYHNTTKPHAVNTAFGYTHSYDNNGNLTSRTGGGQTWDLRYTGFDKPRWMAKTVGSTTVGSEFLYNADRSRTVQLEFDQMTSGAPSRYVRKRVYGLGPALEANYDNTATSGTPNWSLKKVRIYVSGPDGTIGAREFDITTGAAGTEKALVYHHDHLGSIDSITPFASSATSFAADPAGKTGRFSEDAWGQRRDPLDWAGAPTTATDDGGAVSLTPRGFTGHEMLDDLGLVHMNGRIYDPLLGRFFSADIHVQYPDDLQSYNRYSYVSNSPLTYRDPSGYSEELPFVKLDTFYVSEEKVGKKGSTFNHDGYGYLVLSDRLDNGAVRALRLDFVRPAQPANVNVSLTPGAISVPNNSSALTGSAQQAATAASSVASAAASQAAGDVDGDDAGENEPDQTVTRKAMGFLPVVGSALDAYDAYKKGNYGMALIHSALAITDATGVGALGKGILVGGFKLTTRNATKLWGAYFKTGSWKSMRRNLIRSGVISKQTVQEARLAKSLTVDHVFFSRQRSHWLSNLPPNLQPEVTRSLNSMMNSGDLFQNFLAGPSWAKVAAAGGASWSGGLLINEEQ